MMTVTDSANEELKRILETKSLEPGRSLRLAMPPTWEGQGDFGIVIDEERDGDRALLFQGLTVLLVGADLEGRLASAVLDFKESTEGPRFTLDVF